MFKAVATSAIKRASGAHSSSSMVMRTRTFHNRSIISRGGGGDHHAPAPPSFVRLPQPTKPLPEEYELLWSDPVAPEMALDFDAPHISRLFGLGLFFAGLTFFGSVILFNYKIVDAPSRRIAAKRELPYDGLKEELGGYNIKRD